MSTSSNNGPADAERLARQGELIRLIAIEIAGTLKAHPGEFERVVLTDRSLQMMSQREVIAYRPDGSVEGFVANAPVSKYLRELREVMYVPDAGTWFDIALTVTSTGQVSTEFNYDREPAWTREIPAHLYVSDAKKFPRNAENTPAWLAQRLAEGHENPAG